MLFTIKCPFKYNIYNYKDWSCRRQSLFIIPINELSKVNNNNNNKNRNI